MHFITTKLTLTNKKPGYSSFLARRQDKHSHLNSIEVCADANNFETSYNYKPKIPSLSLYEDKEIRKTNTTTTTKNKNKNKNKKNKTKKAKQKNPKCHWARRDLTQ